MQLSQILGSLFALCVQKPRVNLAYFTTREYSDYPNEIAASGLFQLMRYSALPAASRISCPVVIVALEDDVLCPIKNAEDVARAGDWRVELIKVPGGEVV
jgi:pimeloyl-ACP methyl ester carboxylesterase